MRVRGGRDRGGVHLFRKFFEGRRGRHAEFRRATAPRTVAIRVVNRGESAVGSSRIKPRVIFPDVPDADHANAKRFHHACASFCRNHS